MLINVPLEAGAPDMAKIEGVAAFYAVQLTDIICLFVCFCLYGT
jgi:hypothetical protein